MRNYPKLAIIVPCFNEEAVLPETIERLLAVLAGLERSSLIHQDSYVCFVDDGSSDRTWDIVSVAQKSHRQICGIRLSRNFGHQNALFAGLLHAQSTVDCVVSIDADLQQDENAIPQFVDQYKAGCEIVYGIRRDRRTDTFFKKCTATCFYHLMNWMGAPIVHNHADYRLISSKALNALAQYGEINLFLRGICAQLGFRTGTVYFDVSKRLSGETKYPLLKMLSFAFAGITAFSTIPLRIVTFAGFFCFLISALMSGYVFVQTLVIGKAVPGWASTVLPIYFIGGIQILCVGVVGEYVGRIYLEAKARPRFIVDETINFDGQRTDLPDDFRAPLKPERMPLCQDQSQGKI